MSRPDPAELAAVLAVALAESGRTLDDLTATEATDIAAKFRAAASLATASPRDVHMARLFEEAAIVVERKAGIT